MALPKKSRFYGMVIYGNYWYDDTDKKVAKLKDIVDLGHLAWSDVPVHSVKAAKRFLRKHDEIPVGTKCRLNSRYVGGDVYLTKRNPRAHR